MHETAEKSAQNKTAAPPTEMTRVFNAPRAMGLRDVDQPRAFQGNGSRRSR